MAKATLEEIKAKADEYAKLAKQIARAEKMRDAELAPILTRHEEELAAASDKFERKINRLTFDASAIKAEVLAWLGPRKKTYAAESELATFGVEVGTKQLERQPDKPKLLALCKKKGVEFFDLVNVMLAEADKRLGKKDVDEISTRRTVDTRSEYLKLK